MVASMLLHLSVAVLPITPAVPVSCQFDVLPPFVLEERVLLDFRRRVDHYVRLHRRLERALPPEQLFDDFEDMTGAIDALHEAMIDARPNARAGGFFTPAVGEILSRALERAMAANGYTADEILRATNLGRYRGLALDVNGRFPAVLDFQVWPALLAVLPELPHELQYRLVGRDLVLVDAHADLVVDILKDALPAAQAPIRQPTLY